MKRVTCKSGLTGWQAKLQDTYSNFEEWEAYAKMYGLAERFGYPDPLEAWAANPTIQGSTNPADSRNVDGVPYYESIIIDVYYFAAGGFWHIGATAYVNDDDLDVQPESYGDNETANSKREAIDTAKFRQELFLMRRVAKRVIIHVSGNELSCKSLTDVVSG